MNMNIRQATLNDAKILAQLNGHVQQIHVDALPHIFKRDIVGDELVALHTERLNRNEGRYWIAEDDRQAIGYINALIIDRPENLFRYALQYILVDAMSVNPEYYGSGVADKLMQVVKDWATEIEIQRIVLDVWAFNRRAKRFYEKQGFTTYNYRMELVLE